MPVFKCCMVPVRLLGLNPLSHHLTLVGDYYRPGAVARGSTSQREGFGFMSQSKALLSDVCILSLWFSSRYFRFLSPVYKGTRAGCISNLRLFSRANAGWCRPRDALAASEVHPASLTPSSPPTVSGNRSGPSIKPSAG